MKLKKNLAFFLTLVLAVTMTAGTTVPALASEGSDNPYELIMIEEPKPSSGTGVVSEGSGGSDSAEAD